MALPQDPRTDSRAFLQVEGLAPTYTPSKQDLTALFLHSAVGRTGNVSFSHAVLDGVQKAIVQTEVSTRTLGRRTAPFQPFLIPNRVPYGVTPIS